MTDSEPYHQGPFLSFQELGIVSVAAKIGQGVYTASDAARFARVRPRTLRRWFWGEAGCEPILRAEFAVGEELLSFVNLVEAIAVRNLRLRREARAVPLPALRDALRFAESEFAAAHVLARPHRLFAFDGKVWIDWQGEIIGLSAGDRAQILEHRVVEPYLEELSFGPENGFAVRWEPLQRKGHAIVLDPARRLGHPIIDRYGVLASTLAESVESEGGIDEAAWAHGVDRDAVVLALKYADEYLREAG